MGRTWFAAGIVAGAVGLVPAAGRAQLVEVYEPPQSMLGIGAIVTRPVGEFREFVDWGGGLALHGVVGAGDSRQVGVRFEGSFVVYGQERFSAPLSATVPRVLVDVTTSNMIFHVGMGPQIALARGPVRPYVFGTMGFSYFATVSSVGGSADFGEFASSTNFDDVAFALSAGTGLLVQLSRGRRPVSLDLSVESTHNGEVEYLTRGDVVDNPDGSVTVFPIRSEANYLTFRVGVAIGL